MSNSQKSHVDPQQAASELLRRRDARRNLLDFTRYTFPDFESNWHHERIFSALDRFSRRECRRLMIFAPPRHTKSESVSRRLPAYLFGLHPACKIIACSHTASLATDMCRDVQNIMDGEAYRRLFPKTQLNGRNIRTVAYGSYLRNSETFETVPDRGRYICAGVGGPITGKGFDFGIIDDIFKNADEANSPLTRSKIVRWYNTTFRTRQQKDACILVTLTRWHHEDLAGFLTDLMNEDEEADQWEVLSFPAIAEKTRPDYDPRAEGEPLWPNRFGAQFLKATQATMTPHDWLALYQQRPTPEEGGHFKLNWFGTSVEWSHRDIDDAWRLTDKDGNTKIAHKPDCTIYIVVDPASTEKESSDYTAIGVFAVTPQADLIVLDMVRERLGIDAIPPRILDVALRWDPTFIGFEADGFQTSVVRECRRLGRMPPIREFTHGCKSKLVRASEAIIKSAAGQVYLPSDAPWVKEFKKELQQFTGLGDAHDDQLDAFAYAASEAKYLTESGGAKGVNPDHHKTTPQRESNAGRRGIGGRR